METVLAILMALGIFVGIPAVIGFTIVGTFALIEHRAKRAAIRVTAHQVTPEAAKI